MRVWGRYGAVHIYLALTQRRPQQPGLSLKMSGFKQAETYDAKSSQQKEDGLNLLSLLDPSKGLKILDLGCGTGFLTKALADRVGPHGKVAFIYSCKMGFFVLQ